MSSELGLWDWHQAAVAGDPSSQKPCDLVLFSTDGRPVARYHLEATWPAKVELVTEPGAPGTVTETVTLVADTLRRLPPT